MRELRAEAGRSGAARLPLWIAGDHVPCSLGGVNDDGPRVASLDTGGTGLGIMMNEKNAKRAGVTFDYASMDFYITPATGQPVPRISPKRPLWIFEPGRRRPSDLGGRYWFRTSDPSLVRRVLYR